MTDIRIHEESVIFHKALYHESELLLAKCYNFDINLETGEITAPLRFTAKEALFYFIELAFKNFWESPLQEDRKSDFLKQVDEIYAVYENHVSVTMGNKLPYSEKFKKHQIEAANFSFFNKNTFLALEMRLGKAQPLWSQIMTPHGVVKMRDLKINDRVLSSNGLPCNVTGLFPQGKIPFYKIYFSDNTYTECCDNHLWIVREVNLLKKYPWRIKSLKDLRNQDLFIHRKNRSKIPKFRIPKTQPVFFCESKKELKPIHPYLLGVLIGDGCIISNISISTDDHEELFPIIRPMLPAGMIIKKQKGDNYSWNVVMENCSRGTQGNPLIKMLRDLELFNLHSYEKFVPEQYIFTSAEERIDLLSGLLDTDGHVSLTGSRLSFSTSSPRLRDNVIFIVQSLGGLATYLEDNRDNGKRTNYVVSIVFENNIVPFKLTRRINRYQKKQRILGRKIVKIEYAGETDCQCISVDSPDNSYLTNDFIVTHNTIVSASLSRLLNIRKTVIICPASVKWSWFRQLTAEWGFNELYFTILDASKSKNIIAFQERFVIINYDVLGNFYNHLVQTPIGHFIIDESHRLKNHQTARFKNTKKLVDMFPDAKITLLSGTPIKNRVNDIFAYLKLTGHPLGSNHKRFLDEYAISTTSRGAQRVTGGKNLVDLRKKLANFMLIKTQDECLDLPKKMFLSYRYSLDDYREKYNAIIEELSQQKDISSLTGNLHSLNILTSLAKIKGIVEIAEDIIENGQKVVIFGSYKDPLNELEQYFGERCVKIDGSVPSQKRDTLVQRFTNDEKCEVFLGNMQAAGEGINLAVASNVIFINFPLTPDEIMQPLNRCENMNRKGILTICYTFCDESIDEYLYELIEDKQNEINTFTGKENLNIHRHNTVEHLVSKLLKRDIPAEEEAVTHSLEGGEDVTMKDNFVNHMMSVKQVVIPDVNPDAHIMPDFSKPVIDIPDFNTIEKVVEKHIEEINEQTADTMKKLTEEIIVTGKAEIHIKKDDFDLPEFL